MPTSLPLRSEGTFDYFIPFAVVLAVLALALSIAMPVDNYDEMLMLIAP